jgi:hypothetical protein
MQAGDVKLGKIFSNDHVNVIPLFQRPYVWNANDNWSLLWNEMKYAANEVAKDRATGSRDSRSPLYFLGAVVVQQRHKDPRRLESSFIIDGQQRLTTLQVVIAALRSVAFRAGKDKLVGKCTALLENREETLDEDFPEDIYKVWPLPQDRDAFLWAVRRPSDGTPAPDENHQLVRCRIWFEKEIAAWLDEGDSPEERLDDIVHALQDRMQMVQINLDVNDNSQVIFEALNHRGVRLASADLVKNRLFYALESQGDGGASEEALLKYWLELDTPYWRETISSGAVKRDRVDNLITYWLSVRLADEVPVDSLFTYFTRWMDENKESIRAIEVIKSLRFYADTYKKLVVMKPSSATGKLVRSLEVTKMSVVWPTLLALHTDTEIPFTQREIAAAAIDSYLTRRVVLKLTWKDYNRLFVQILKEIKSTEPDRAGQAVVDCLASQTAESRYWPNDTEFREGLTAPDLYKKVSSARLKSVLIGIENHLRTGKTTGDEYLNADASKLSIEHVMPQKWQDNWEMPEGSTDEDVAVRVEAVDSLGNLTLATTKLNSSLSNKGWDEKRDALKIHSLVHITTRSILSTPTENITLENEWSDEWDETRIDIRGNWMADLALKIWTRPPHAKDLATSTAGKEETVNVKDILQSGLLNPGTLIVSTTQAHLAEAIILADGSIEFEGTVYATLSGAATAAQANGKRPNGWTFWAVLEDDGSEIPMADYRSLLQ